MQRSTSDTWSCSLTRGLAVLLTLSAMAASGCSLSARAGGSVKSSGEVSGESSMNMQAEQTQEAAPDPSPPETPSIRLKQGRLEYRGVINFEYNKALLREDEDTSQTMTEFLGFLKDHPEVSLEIEGHTDSRGSEEYNLSLSERRANAVRDWLIAKGVDAERLSAVGKGEGAPQVAEPEGCQNPNPPDASACEEVWATNRRVVFEVTEGEETIEEPEAPPPPPAPEPVAEPKAPRAAASSPGCHWLFGGRLTGFGPNSWVMVDAVTQPGICWLELSLGLGYGAGRFSTNANGFTARGYYSAFTIPVRGRFWLMDRGHSLVLDLGLGFTKYSMDASSANASTGRFDYERGATPFLTTLAAGYGFRPEGGQPGYRFAAMIGGAFHPSSLDDSSSSVSGGFGPGNAAALSTALDERTEDFTDPSVFVDVSLGLLF